MNQLSAILPLITYCFVNTVTPGPNNTMLLSSGSRFGFRRTLPHVFGILVGVAVIVTTLDFGLAGIIASHPTVKRVLTVISFVWILWIAWKLFTAPDRLEVADPDDAAATAARPMSFLGAAAFQWVNPKAWAMVLGAIGGWGTQVGLLTLVLAFALTGLPSISLWAAAGQALRGWLSQPGRMRAFNIVMAVLLVASILPVLWE